ncbi:MAG: exonuclease subunit SbcD [Bacteroidales bacterium]|nr:exonuclease subunit SbcD [Bacteroidales bacterium]
MKIIHTSDWHIGQTLYQYSREEEHEFFFEQLKSIIINEKPDALVVSGDIFHSATPTVLSQRLYYHTLVELSRLYEDLQIIVVAGNHDSPSRLEAPQELWTAFNVTVIGSLDFYRNTEVSELPYDASKIQIPIKRNDEIIGWVLAVPHINAGNYPSLKENDSYSNRVLSFYNNLKDSLRQNPQYEEKHAVVSTGHFMISSANVKNNHNIVGGEESIESSGFSSMSGIDYWALGHVHHPQNIADNERIRYSGSPFAMTFNEDYEHSVTVVNIENHVLDVKIVDIKPLIPILDFPSKPDSYEDACDIEEVMTRLCEITDKKYYVRLHVGSKTSVSDVINAKILEAFKDKEAKYCGIQLHMPKKENIETASSIMTLDDFKAISPFMLGCEVYKKKNNEEMPEEMKKMFEDVCNEVMKQCGNGAMK